jgi:D-alanyl-D-alanine dipeptidase
MIRRLALALLLAHPAQAQNLPPGWVRLSDHAPGIAQDIRYARAFNFTGAPVPGYGAAECILRVEAADALIRVQETLAPQGLALIVWDCYRPTHAVDHFADWAASGTGPELAAHFFPGLPRTDLIPQGYIARQSSHSSGGTVDLGLIRLGDVPLRPEMADTPCTAPHADRPPETTLDMGTAFDCFSPLSAEGAEIPEEARKNRQTLTAAMEAEGFKGYAAEWWHFRLPLEEAQPQDFPITR